MPPLRLTAPIEKEFVLKRSDRAYGGNGTRITIRQATQAQHERRSELFDTLTREYSEGEDGTVRYIQKFSILTLMRLETYLTMVSCQIEDEKGKPLFRPNMTEVEFNRSWGKLPPDVCAEIHEFVYEVNPTWSPLYSPPASEEETEPEVSEE